MPRAGGDPAVDIGALELVPEAVVVLDADGIVEHANTRTGALLGHGGLVGRRLVDAVRLQDEAGRDCGDRLLQLSPVADRLAERIVQVVLDDGRTRPLAVAGRRAGDRLVVTFRNASRRQQLDAARSDLVATVSHEVRSPLTSVKGFTRTMLGKWERFSDEQKQAMLETINADADRVTRLLTELLDVSRIDAGRVRLRSEPVEVAPMVDTVVAKAGLRPEGASRSVDVDLEADLPRVLADRDKFEQVLTNLLENALKYAPEAPVRIAGAAVDGSVRVTVADEGPGIPRAQLRHIFEKFGRGRDSRRAGTGLGLYISRGLVEAQGGQVWCESEPGVGTAFHVLLPTGEQS